MNWYSQVKMIVLTFNTKGMKHHFDRYFDNEIGVKQWRLIFLTCREILIGLAVIASDHNTVRFASGHIVFKVWRWVYVHFYLYSRKHALSIESEAANLSLIVFKMPLSIHHCFVFLIILSLVSITLTTNRYYGTYTVYGSVSRLL